MTEEMLYTGFANDIKALVDACEFPQDAFVLVERLPSSLVADMREERQDLLRFARLGDGIDMARYATGRIFSQDFELRWEKEGERYKVVYLGTPEYFDAARQHADLHPDSDTLSKLRPSQKPRRYYLFGEYLDEGRLSEMGIAPEPGTACYAEVRIPRLLRYPELPEKPRRVQLAVREYNDEATGRVQLFRFQGLEAEEQNV
jgi:hypothetical protein